MIPQGQLRYPTETMLAKGLSPTFTRTLVNSMKESSQTKLSADDQTRFREVVYEIASQAYGHLDRARYDLLRPSS